MINVQSLIRQYLPEKLRQTWVARLLGFLAAKLLKQDEINQFLKDHEHLKGYDFIDAVLDYFQFSYQTSARDSEAIPAEGRCVIVANHPLGALDGLGLLHMVLNIRPDVRIVANEVLSSLPALDEYLLPINNLSGETSRSRMTAISRCLEEEMAVIIFPAGEVSRTHWFKIRDCAWGKGFYLFAKRTNAKVVPVFISGKNSFWFYAWSKINSMAAMLLLPRQMWRQRNKVITMKVGTPLEFAMLKQLPVDDKQKVKMVRKHVYQLGKNRRGLFSVPDPVAHPERRNDLRLSINNCEVLGRDAKDQRILLFETQDNSPLLREIGRLRELTFRQVGEGSAQRRDLDKYDTYYDHLIIWNDHDLEIMGAYRVLPTQSLKPDEDLSPLYTSSLFNYAGDLSWLTQGLELGRSFVQPRYWGTRSLDYLWQGIGAYYVRHPQVRYLFGTVSISAAYPKEAINYLVAYFRHYFHNPAFAVTSKAPYRLSGQQQKYYDALFADVDQKTAYKTMKLHLREMNVVVPTLFKHYSELCKAGGVTFTDFGIDPDFGDCVDGFVIVDLHYIKASKHSRYVQPFLGALDEEKQAKAKASEEKNRDKMDSAVLSASDATPVTAAKKRVENTAVTKTL